MSYTYRNFANKIRLKKGFLTNFLINPLIAFNKGHTVCYRKPSGQFNKDRFKAQIMHNQVGVCSILATSFHYEWNFWIYVNDLADNNSIYVFSAEIYGFCS